MQHVMLFLHALTGCDATSSIFGKGKLNAYKILSTSKELHTKALLFYEKEVEKETLKEVGDNFF